MVIAVNARYNSNCNCDYGDHKVTIEIMFINQSRKSLSNNVGIVEQGILRGCRRYGFGQCFHMTGDTIPLSRPYKESRSPRTKESTHSVDLSSCSELFLLWTKL